MRPRLLVTQWTRPVVRGGAALPLVQKEGERTGSHLRSPTPWFPAGVNFLSNHSRNQRARDPVDKGHKGQPPEHTVDGREWTVDQERQTENIQCWKLRLWGGVRPCKVLWILWWSSLQSSRSCRGPSLGPECIWLDFQQNPPGCCVEKTEEQRTEQWGHWEALTAVAHGLSCSVACGIFP